MTRKNTQKVTKSYFQQIEDLIRDEERAEREAMYSGLNAEGTDFLDAENALDQALDMLDRLLTD